MTNTEMALSHLRQARRILSEHIERLVSVSRRLRQEREISFDGNEELGAPPERLYSADDAGQALGDARFVIDLAGTHVR